MELLRTLGALGLVGLLSACGERAAEPIPTPVLTGDMVTKSGIAKNFFGAKTYGSSLPAAPYGSYSKGCLAGGVQLPESGPTWQAMRLSRNRHWAHPETVEFVKRLSRKAAALPGSDGLYIGDMSQPRGGPMLSGHRSHQVGLDADIWLMPKTRDLSRAQRETISATTHRRARGAYVNDRWSRYHHELIKAAAQDPAVARIFIFPGAKVQMCNDEKGSKAWLNKVRPWWGHHYHFHVRLSCPDGATGCENQAPPPPGDGCAAARDWVDNILNPPPPDPDAPPPKPRPELTMADLPAACQAVLAR